MYHIVAEYLHNSFSSFNWLYHHQHCWCCFVDFCYFIWIHRIPGYLVTSTCRWHSCLHEQRFSLSLFLFSFIQLSRLRLNNNNSCSLHGIQWIWVKLSDGPRFHAFWHITDKSVIHLHAILAETSIVYLCSHLIWIILIIVEALNHSNLYTTLVALTTHTLLCVLCAVHLCEFHIFTEYFSTSNSLRYSQSKWPQHLCTINKAAICSGRSV